MASHSPAAELNRAKPPIFYGWWILVASVVIELFGLGFGVVVALTLLPRRGLATATQGELEGSAPTTAEVN